MNATKKTSPFSWLAGLLARHSQALSYVLVEILPVIIRTGRRPVVFARYVGLGDIICSIPAAKLLKQRHPGATFIFNCHHDFRAIPRLTGVTDRVTSFKHIALMTHWYRFLLEKFYFFHHGDPVNGGTFMEQFCAQYGLPPVNEHPRFTPDAASLEAARQILQSKKIGPRPFIVIHPGPTDPLREWPLDKWTDLVASLQRLGFDIIQIGISRHVTFGSVESEPVPGTVSLVDQLSLEESIAVISLARMYVGIDSGPLHLAAMVGTPAVGLFGAITPHLRFAKEYCRYFVVSRVECQGCGHYMAATPYVGDCPYHIRCMKEMSSDEVLRACQARLETSMP